MKNKIFWLIQSNQVTPIIIDFLRTLQIRLEQYMDLIYIVPDSSSDIIERIKPLNPELFKTNTRTATYSYPAYKAKKDALNNDIFTDGLSFSDTLLIDDLGGGNIIQTFMDLKKPEHTCGLILQIPTPLGSSDSEERVYHAAILWARQNNIPSIGYELLPLDTRWTLAPTLPDGIITKSEESYDYLREVIEHNNIWLLPLYEASIFSSVATNFNITGTKASYHYKNTASIPPERTVLYIPHNVAMIYEYKELLQIIQTRGKELHMMFCYAQDQVRGIYTHKEIIETVYHKELKKFASYSFHDVNNPSEIMMADSVIACSACFQTDIARDKNIPCLIFDPTLPPAINGYKKRVNQKNEFLESISKVIKTKSKKNDFAEIIMMLARKGKKNG